MKRVTVNIYNRQRKLTVTPPLKTLVEECAAASLDCEEFDEPATVDVTFVSNRKIREYNREFRNVDRETDVLSFPFAEEEYYTDPDSGDVMLGDIVISLEKAAEQAAEYGHSYEREVGFFNGSFNASSTRIRSHRGGGRRYHARPRKGDS